MFQPYLYLLSWTNSFLTAPAPQFFSTLIKYCRPVQSVGMVQALESHVMY